MNVTHVSTDGNVTTIQNVQKTPKSQSLFLDMSI